jgi:ribosomal protein L10
MPTAQKEQLVEEIKDRFNDSGAVLLADYRGLSV